MTAIVGKTSCGETSMQLGASLPVGDIGTGPAVIRDYAQAAEGLGFSYLLAPDHVLGANPDGNYEGRRVGTTATAYHDPFVLFGFLAGCTKSIGFASGVLILPHRRRRWSPSRPRASTCCAAATAASGSASGSDGTK